ncbi:MAG: F0F1 ATP synthase subunit epsilon [Haliea sp.]|uniref:F0F1 ATP synthase subunit epsilon n=1 Tax=Haliea sp. TaxID=1932666 RepID=UPI0032ED1665
MTGFLSLSITTPLKIVLQETSIASLRGEDSSGGFGILPGHGDFVTVIDAGVLRWRGATGRWRYCAVRGGVFTVIGGREVHVACRDAVTGDDLTTLQAQVARTRAERVDTARSTRTGAARLHARAIRRLMQGMALGGDTLGLDVLEDDA